MIFIKRLKPESFSDLSLKFTSQLLDLIKKNPSKIKEMLKIRKARKGLYKAQSIMGLDEKSMNLGLMRFNKNEEQIEFLKDALKARRNILGLPRGRASIAYKLGNPNYSSFDRFLERHLDPIGGGDFYLKNAREGKGTERLRKDLSLLSWEIDEIAENKKIRQIESFLATLSGVPKKQRHLYITPKYNRKEEFY